MTRKDELEARARDYVFLFVMSGAEPAATKNLTWMLQHVEREVLANVAQQAQRYQQFIFGQERSREFEAGFRAASHTLEGWITAQQKELG